MKKLTLAVFAIAFCISTNAATVDWQYKITDSAKGTGAYSGYTVYLVDQTEWNAAVISGITSDTFADSSIVYDSAVFNNGVVSKSASTYSTLNKGSMPSARAVSLNDSIVAEGGTLSVYYIVLNANSSPNEWKNLASAGLVGRASEGQQEAGGLLTTDKATFDGGTWTPVGAGPTPVPEPTTGLLVLTGLAGLALRRRRA